MQTDGRACRAAHVVGLLSRAATGCPASVAAKACAPGLSPNPGCSRDDANGWPAVEGCPGWRPPVPGSFLADLVPAVPAEFIFETVRYTLYPATCCRWRLCS